MLDDTKKGWMDGCWMDGRMDWSMDQWMNKWNDVGWVYDSMNEQSKTCLMPTFKLMCVLYNNILTTRTLDWLKVATSHPDYVTGQSYRTINPN